MQHLNLCELLDYRAWQAPDKVAYQFLHRGEEISRQLSYGQLQSWVRSVALRLNCSGVKGHNATGQAKSQVKGRRALLLFSPGLDFVAAFLGCLYAGVIAVPAYPPKRHLARRSLAKQDLAKQDLVKQDSANQNASIDPRMMRLQAIVEDAGADFVLTTSDLYQKIAPCIDADSPLGHASWIAVDSLDSTFSFGHDQATVKSACEPDAIAFLQYTSGSTGTPKGVVVSHANLLHNLSLIYEGFGHSEESRGVIWLPPYHDMGLIGGVLQPLYGGFPVTLMAPIDFLQKPLRWLKAISRFGATTSGGPDFAYDLCVRKFESLQANSQSNSQSNSHLNNSLFADWICDLDLSRWRVAFTGAEPVRADTLARFAETFAPYGFRPEAFYPCYGMAETTLIISGGQAETTPVVKQVDSESLRHRQVKETAGESLQASRVVGCGQTLGDFELVIVDPERNVRCELAAVGEIWVRGESVAQGYWQDEEKTRHSFEAYLYGDEKLGGREGPFLRTGDLGFIEDGELFVTGRIKDVMIIRGRNYYPQDIERSLEAAHPAIRASGCAAFSVEQQGGERLVVVCEVKRTHLRSLDAKAVSTAIRQTVSALHDLQVYAALLVRPGAIPKTSSGKIQRYRCRDLFLSNSFAVVEDWSENPRHKREFVQMQSDVDAALRTVEKTIEQQTVGARK